MFLLLTVLVVGAGLCVLLNDKLQKFAPKFIAMMLGAGFLYFLSQLESVWSAPVVQTLEWSKQFGVDFSFRLDGLGLIFGLLITGIGTGVYLYAGAYMQSYPRLGAFYAALTMFTAAMLGMVLSDNMLSFFLFWEMTSLCSFLLIAYKNEDELALASARKALFITVGGGLALLLAISFFAVIGLQNGLTLSEAMKFSNLTKGVVDSEYYVAILLCLLVAVGTKSAQFPFHIWLPAAMSGPTPVSSFLHSATMVKAGIFLLARVSPALNGTELWFYSFTTLGALTLLASAALAMAQKDMKKILAYSTVSVLGILVMLLGVGSDKAIKAMSVFLVAHALYKAALFQIVGNIDVATKSRDITQLGGLVKYLPLTAAAVFLSSFSMAGSPPLIGFFGKELAYLAKVQMGAQGVPLMIVTLVANGFLVGLAFSICFRPFWGKAAKDFKTHPVPITMQLVPLLFATAGLMIGVFPRFFDEFVGSMMVSSVAGKSLDLKLKLWHGFGFEALTVLGLSILTLAAGVFIALKLEKFISKFARLIARIEGVGPSRLFDRFLIDFPRLCKKLTAVIQNGDLRSYLVTSIVGIVGLVCVPFVQSIELSRLSMETSPVSIALAVLIIVPLLTCVRQRDVYGVLLAIGISGVGTVVYFAVYGAFDLALTQLMVETLSIVFLILLLRKTTRKVDLGKNTFAHMVVAAVFGVFMFLANHNGPREVPNFLSDFYMQNAFESAFGRNVVNVILVDFRALDTFGEALVVAIAALGIAVLLRPRWVKKS